MAKKKGEQLLSVADIPTWLEQHGYQTLSRQAIHKAIHRGSLKPEQEIRYGQRVLRLFRESEVRRYAEQRN